VTLSSHYSIFCGYYFGLKRIQCQSDRKISAFRGLFEVVKISEESAFPRFLERENALELYLFAFAGVFGDN
jgi:hypothetical protein